MPLSQKTFNKKFNKYKQENVIKLKLFRVLKHVRSSKYLLFYLDPTLFFVFDFTLFIHSYYFTTMINAEIM
jgi:hypothetical protein